MMAKLITYRIDEKSIIDTSIKYTFLITKNSIIHKMLNQQVFAAPKLINKITTLLSVP